MYVSMIKALRIIDSSDLLLNFIAAPIRRYLVIRKDTVRCIVQSLIEGEGSDLHSELRRGGPLEYLPDSDDEDGGPGHAWEPRSRNSELAESGSHGLDILALLVSIYGSTDIFVSEYRSIMAEKILSNVDFKYDHEVAILELLKIRFGEDPLQSCEIMLRDLEESGRVTTAIFSELRKTAKVAKATSEVRMDADDDDEVRNHAFDCVIVSDNYWPQLHSGEVLHHPTALALMDSYNDAYHSLKKPRKLHPLPLLGHVDVDLDFDDGSSRSFSVKPIQATLILHLADKGKMNAGELSELTQVEEEEVCSQMAFWVGAHVCVAASVERDVDPLDPFPDASLVTWYTIDEAQSRWAEADARAGDSGDGMASANQDGGSAVDAEASQRAAVATWGEYTRGMLRSHGAMPLERIHTMLRMMSSAGDVQFDLNLVELKAFLSRLNDVELVNNTYNLRGKA
jgi:anaphase-promoting complex subunit 2